MSTELFSRGTGLGTQVPRLRDSRSLGGRWLRRRACVGLLRLGLVGLIFSALNGEGHLAFPRQPSSPPPKVGNCASLAAEDIFEEITPPDVRASTSVPGNVGGSQPLKRYPYVS
jgi:hypothetical protein